MRALTARSASLFIPSIEKIPGILHGFRLSSSAQFEIGRLVMSPLSH